MKPLSRLTTVTTVRYRISRTASALFLTGALIGDAIQILMKLLWFTVFLGILGEAIGWFITLVILMTYGTIFGLKGVHLIGHTRALSGILRTAAVFFIECLPVLNFIPSLTIWTWSVIRAARKEDEENAKKEAARNAKIHQALLKRRRLRTEAYEARTGQPRIQALHTPMGPQEDGEMPEERGAQQVMRRPILGRQIRRTDSQQNGHSYQHAA